MKILNSCSKILRIKLLIFNKQIDCKFPLILICGQKC